MLLIDEVIHLVLLIKPTTLCWWYNKNPWPMQSSLKAPHLSNVIRFLIELALQIISNSSFMFDSWKMLLQSRKIVLELVLWLSFVTHASVIDKSQTILERNPLPCGFLSYNTSTNEGQIGNSHGERESHSIWKMKNNGRRVR